MTAYRGKRALDLLVTAALAVPALAIGLACALAVLLEDGRPVFFRQQRAGLGGEPFDICKFRTMTDHGEANPLFPSAERITKVGRVLRRLSLDELPQLINVWRGEMSIVGPRPTLEYQVERYSSRQRGRLLVRPGVTGLAQITGRNELPWAERIEIDLDYVARQSLRLDIGILFRSAFAVLKGSGVEGHPVEDPIAKVEPE